MLAGFLWKFTPADAIKRTLKLTIGDNILTFSELQTVCFEVANLVNERPIGRHSTSPDDGTYLCPNDVLLGRSSPRIPSEPFKETSNLRHRFEFVKRIINRFWKKWTTDYFQSLIVRKKWHTSARNVKEGDIVLILIHPFYKKISDILLDEAVV